MSLQTKMDDSERTNQILNLRNSLDQANDTIEELKLQLESLMGTPKVKRLVESSAQEENGESNHLVTNTESYLDKCTQTVVYTMSAMSL